MLLFLRGRFTWPSLQFGNVAPPLNLHNPLEIRLLKDLPQHIFPVRIQLSNTNNILLCQLSQLNRRLIQHRYEDTPYDFSLFPVYSLRLYHVLQYYQYVCLHIWRLMVLVVYQSRQQLRLTKIRSDRL